MLEFWRLWALCAIYIIHGADGQTWASCGELAFANGSTPTTIPWTAKLFLRDEEATTDKTYAALILSPTMVLMYANDLRSQGNLERKIRIYPLEKYVVISNTSKFSELPIDSPFVQSSAVTHIRIHPNYNAELNWTLIENNIAVVHLATPIIFDSNVHAVCMPKLNEINNFYSLSNDSHILLSGWRRHADETVIIKMSPVEEEQCLSWWKTDSKIQGYTQSASYSNRVCLNASKDNSHIKCINVDVGSYVQKNGGYYFSGFMNNFFGDSNRACSSDARFFISKLTPTILKFIEHNMKCGPNHFACNNGDCITLKGTVCNQITDCADGSDEDPKYCRGLNYCDTSEFPCGVYGKCIKESQKCNGEIDCDFAEDEDENICGKSHTVMIAGVVSSLVIIILCLTVAAVVFWNKMKFAEQALRELTDDEVAEFEHGIGIVQEQKHGNHFYSNTPTNKDESVAWDKYGFEIPKENLHVDWHSVLGSGVAGIVYNGKFINRKSADKTIDVAVKTFKSSADVESLKALLSELKIMTKVGTHENIVGLVGAYTREIKQRLLYIALELCPMGSLDKYLINNRDRFVHLLDRDGNLRQELVSTSYENMPDTHFTTLEMVRWSKEIAIGMEHLAKLNITHGDLATRNVLLNQAGTTKISDFGLARNLYTSGLYIKKNMAPLPWRWMAIESLRDYEFSTKSDIWSYGVTLWEIFSLGGVPYPGLNWTIDFVTKLGDGLRLQKPAYASTNIYGMMLSCWHTKPSMRPEFNQLKTYFGDLQSSLEQNMTTQITMGLTDAE